MTRTDIRITGPGSPPLADKRVSEKWGIARTIQIELDVELEELKGGALKCHLTTPGLT